MKHTKVFVVSGAMSKLRVVVGVAVLVVAACAHQPGGSILPVADHHQHLLSPVTAPMAGGTKLAAVVLPEELAALVRERVAHWNEKGPLAALYAEDAVFLDRWDPNWLRGRDEVADYVSTQFARPYTVTPVAFGVNGNGAYIAAYFTRGEGAAAKHLGMCSGRS
jgi:hypothetical protein